MIVGGVAAWLNGSSLATNDLDVCCRMTEENMARFIEAIRPLNPKVRGDPRNLIPPLNAKLLATINMLIMVTSLGHFDLVPELPPIGRYDEVLKHSVEMEVEGRMTRVLDIDALIAVKKAVGRPKDAMGVMYLERAKKQREASKQP
ncbi:MAG TPA: hypothetical protein VHS31_16580 [Tepidisphaeraceae bacterium]|nr:hypothetical protein [Tepidisphaeraceae bacterium]